MQFKYKSYIGLKPIYFEVKLCLIKILVRGKAQVYFRNKNNNNYNENIWLPCLETLLPYLETLLPCLEILSYKRTSSSAVIIINRDNLFSF